MNKYYLFILLLFPLNFCSDSEFESDPTPGDYFPLAIGNKWYYDLNGSDEIWEVTEPVELNGKQYRKIVRKNIQSNYKDSTYYRFHNFYTLYYKQKDFDEQILADFSLS